MVAEGLGESWWKGSKRSHCGRGDREVMVAEGLGESWWKGSKGSHGGRGVREAMVVEGLGEVMVAKNGVC